MATATATMQRIRIPTAEDFGDEAYLDAPELATVANALIDRHPSLAHIAEVSVAYLWKKTGGKRGGKGVFGKTAKRSGLVSAFTTADFIIWLAADHIEEADYSQQQLTALMHHELLHIGYEDSDDEDVDRKYVLRGHDLEVFTEEIRVYGAWDALLAEAAEAFHQAPLFGAA